MAYKERFVCRKCPQMYGGIAEPCYLQVIGSTGDDGEFPDYCPITGFQCEWEEDGGDLSG